MSEELLHESGHKFVPNGVGDYNLSCPTNGIRSGFVPYMIARCASARAECSACGMAIGKRIEEAVS